MTQSIALVALVVREYDEAISFFFRAPGEGVDIVRFVEEPREEPYGHVVVFFDLYGNKWDLAQRHGAHGV